LLPDTIVLLMVVSYTPTQTWILDTVYSILSVFSVDE